MKYSLCDVDHHQNIIHIYRTTPSSFTTAALYPFVSPVRYGLPLPSPCRDRASFAPPQSNFPQLDIYSIFYSSSLDRKSTRLNSSHTVISYAVFCLKKKIKLTLAPPSRCTPVALSVFLHCVVALLLTLLYTFLLFMFLIFTFMLNRR